MDSDFDKDRGIDLMQESLLSLGEACVKVGGTVPLLDMTLREFIKIYGWNGVRFSVKVPK